MDNSLTSQSIIDLSNSQDKPKMYMYPQFEEALYSIPKFDDGVSPREGTTTTNANVDILDLSLPTGSYVAIDPAKLKGLEEKLNRENIGMTTSVQVTQVEIMNNRNNLLEEMQESHDLLNGFIRRPNRTNKNSTEAMAAIPPKNVVAQKAKHEIGVLIDTVEKKKLFTEPDSVHDNFAEDDILYTIPEDISNQTQKREERKSDFIFGNVTVKILEATLEKEAMLGVYYIVYKILTAVQVEGKSALQYIVKRRYSEFDALFEHLSAKYQGHVIPILPPKNLKTAFQLGDDEFYKTRQRELGVFLNNCLKHPVVKETDELELFLTDQSGFHSVIIKKDQSYFEWLKTKVWPKLFNLVGFVSTGNIQEKTTIDHGLDIYENTFEMLGQRLQTLLQCLTKLFESKNKGIKSMASFALELEAIKANRERSQESRRQTLSLHSNIDVEKDFVSNMLEKTQTDLKDIINNVESVNVALKRRNDHIRNFHKPQESVEGGEIEEANPNLLNNQKLNELNSECNICKENIQKSSNRLFEEILQYQLEITETLNAFFQAIFQGNEQNLEKVT